MKVTVRTLTGAKYDIDMTDDSKVTDLKSAIQGLTQDDPATQTLIFSGKFMEDDKLISEYNIKEKDFIVLTTKPIKGGNKRQSTSNTNTTNETTTNAPETPAPVTNTNTETPPPTTQTQTTPAPTTPQPEAPSEEAIATITDMGFPRDQAIQALRITSNNVMAALELVMSGTLDNYPAPTGNTPTQTINPGTTTAPTGQPGGQEEMLQQMLNQYMQQGQQGEQQNIFAPLRSNPFFNQIRAMVQLEPGLLQPILQRLEQTQPDLIEVITQNQQQFLDFLHEPVSPELMQQTQEALSQMVDGMGGMEGMQGQQTFQITEEENEIINNLVALGGWNRNKVIEAYFLFDKDETMTAEYLLNHGYDDDFPTDQ